MPNFEHEFLLIFVHFILNSLLPLPFFHQTFRVNNIFIICSVRRLHRIWRFKLLSFLHLFVLIFPFFFVGELLARRFSSSWYEGGVTYALVNGKGDPMTSLHESRRHEKLVVFQGVTFLQRIVAIWMTLTKKIVALGQWSRVFAGLFCKIFLIELEIWRGNSRS